jgi:hypothetical protein
MPATNPYDLMFSNRSLNVTTAEVPIVFRHALSSLHFKFIKPSASEGGPHQVLVHKLAIKGKGTTFINQATFKNNVAMANMEGAPDWQSDKAGVNLPNEYVLFNGNFEVADNASEITGVASFMPIPQNVTSDMKLIISYSIKQKESDATAQVVENLEIPFTSFLFTNTEGVSAYIVSWDMNTRYFYNVSFGALKKIYFHHSVSDWSIVQNAGTFIIE